LTIIRKRSAGGKTEFGKFVTHYDSNDAVSLEGKAHGKLSANFPGRLWVFVDRIARNYDPPPEQGITVAEVNALAAQTALTIMV
jgi:hypothetical protein